MQLLSTAPHPLPVYYLKDTGSTLTREGKNPSPTGWLKTSIYAQKTDGDKGKHHCFNSCDSSEY